MFYKWAFIRTITFNLQIQYKQYLYDNVTIIKRLSSQKYAVKCLYVKYNQGSR